MSITRAKQSSLKTGVVKYDTFRGGLPFTPTIGTATDGGTGSTVSVAFTGNNTAGLTYTALSTPGSLTGTSTTSPITVSGLTAGTAYTFAVKAANSAGDSPYSAASNSVTPATPSSYESIATATPSGVSTVTFSSIPQTYSSLQIRFSILNSQAGNAFELRLNNTTTNYTYHYLNGNGSTVAAGGAISQSTIPVGDLANGTSTTQPMVGIIDIHDYASTTKNKTVRNFGGIDLNGSGGVDLISGLFASTAAVTRLDIFVGGGTYNAGSTVSLYGIKG